MYFICAVFHITNAQGVYFIIPSQPRRLIQNFQIKTPSTSNTSTSTSRAIIRTQLNIVVYNASARA